MASPSPEVEKDFDLRTICDALGDVKTKWFVIGIQLGIPRSKLLEFEEERDPFSAVLDYWLRGNVESIPISWKSIATALKSKYVKEPALAEEIHKKYCPKDDQNTNETKDDDDDDDDDNDDESSASSDSLPLHPDVEMDLEQQLNLDARQIRKKFAFFVTSVQTIVEEKGITAKNLSIFLLSLQASTHDSDKKLIILAELKAELKDAEDITDIFFLLSSKYVSYLNPEIYVSILEKYGSMEEQKKLNYPEHLKVFVKQHTIKEFVKMYPELDNPKLHKPDGNSKTIRIKFNISRTESLSTLQEVTEAVANVLGLRASTLRLYGVKKGCVLVTLLIPTSIADTLFTRDTMFSPDAKRGFRAASVLWLECNGHKFDLRENDELKDTSGLAEEICEQYIPQDDTTRTENTTETDISRTNDTITEQDTTKTDQDITKTPGRTSPQPGGVEKVRKMLMGMYKGLDRLESAQATPLHSAVESCDTDNVRNLLKGLKVKAQTSTAKPKPGKAFLPKLLEKLTGDFEDSNKLKRLGIFQRVVKNLYAISATPLYRATESHDMGKVREVLGQAEYSVNCTDSVGWTPLHYAGAVGNLDMVRMLVSEFKADVTIEDEDGTTALELAALAGHDYVVYALLSEYQCPGVNDALFMACAGGHTTMVQTLVREHNADVNTRDSNNDTPLHMAAKCGNDEVALKLIKEFGCDIEVKGQVGRSLLHSACQGGSANLVRTLIRDYSVDINARNDDNNIPLHLAAGFAKDEVALTLIREFGCDTKVKGQVGRSLLHWACRGGSVNLVRTLIREHNADVNARDDDNDTPLYVAACFAKDEVALTLINEFGCDTKVKGSYSSSLLHSACIGGSVNLVRVLIREHDADINAVNDDNNTPLDVATLFGQDEVVEVLRTEFGCEY